MLFGRTEGAIPSRFISELDDEAVIRISQISPESDFSSRRFSRSTSFTTSHQSARSGQPVWRGNSQIPSSNYSKSERPKFSESEAFTAPPKNRKEAIFGITENDTGYKSGERVRHANFGDGTVIRVDGDVLSVAFAGRGIGKLVASVTPLEKISE